MLKAFRIVVCVLLMLAVGYFYTVNIKEPTMDYKSFAERDVFGTFKSKRISQADGKTSLKSSNRLLKMIIEPVANPPFTATISKTLAVKTRTALAAIAEAAAVTTVESTMTTTSEAEITTSAITTTATTKSTTHLPTTTSTAMTSTSAEPATASSTTLAVTTSTSVEPTTASSTSAATSTSSEKPTTSEATTTTSSAATTTISAATTTASTSAAATAASATTLMPSAAKIPTSTEAKSATSTTSSSATTTKATTSTKTSSKTLKPTLAVATLSRTSARMSRKSTPSTIKPPSLATTGFQSRKQDVIFLEAKHCRKASHISSHPLSPYDILKGENGIIFVETTDRMQPPSLVLCAIESAARVYEDRPVVFFMKGLNDSSSEANKKKYFPSLSSFKNVYVFPLRMEEIFADTPLSTWYQKIDPKKELYWTHVSADGCRLALIWKHGGIYMDTDIISIKRIPHQHFLAAETHQYSSNGIFGLSSHHAFTWKGMEDFAQNYQGDEWGYQGPDLFTRTLQQFCTIPQFIEEEDIVCGNIMFLHPFRFYPIPYQIWKRYYEVWDEEPTFDYSYALHLWNYMNEEGKTMVLGSNTLVEHLYQKYCPSVYGELAGN